MPLYRCFSVSQVLRRLNRVQIHGGLRPYHSATGTFGNQPKAVVVFDPESEQSADQISQRSNVDHRVQWLVDAYRSHGHKKSTIDPLGLKKPRPTPELNPDRYGLRHDSSEELNVSGILNHEKSFTVQELQDLLEKMYCGHVSVEFQYLSTHREREWFARNYEDTFGDSQENFTPEQKVKMAKSMLKSQTFDHFLASKFSTVKRYGCEGAESMVIAFEEVLNSASMNGIDDVIVCMAHRGRNNLLTCVLNYSIVAMLQKMKGKSEFPPGVKGTGDVLSHLKTTVDLNVNDKNVHVTLLPNPSHLEAVNSVAMGKTRSRQRRLGIGDYRTDGAPSLLGDGSVCVQFHGDGALAAQGVIAENFCIGYTPHFRIGGVVHIVVNNQLSFTTEDIQARSSLYASDLGKIVNCPVVHVNADYPEDVVRACRLAMAYRQVFRKDVIVDLCCYRKLGHNELDDPWFTQPLMYDAIKSRRSIPDKYADKLVHEGVWSAEELDSATKSWMETLQDEMKQIDTYVPKANHLERQWSGLVQAPCHVTTWDTGVDVDLLKFIGAKSVELPDSLAVHPTLRRGHVEKRLGRLIEGTGIDWATAEALAIGSLLYQGVDVRISGQDVGRGTFSHRHVMLVDQTNDEMYIPLNHLTSDQKGHLEVAHSALSEEAVLGFEYGFSIEDPNLLPIWEAQFGDFFNGAQIMIDTFISTGEAKWLLQSGLVLLLPHGYDGAGPEHSSCRIERFLQMCDSKEDAVEGDDINMQIANPTTPAQYFHLLRRQIVRNYRKPLVVAAPKMILRLPAASSSLSDMTPGTTFRPVLGDESILSFDRITRVVICSGKHYYALDKHRQASKTEDTAIIRLESLCPFPAEEIRQEILKYKNAKEFIWSQEEHRNMGPWFYVNPRFEYVVGKKLKYAGRDVLAAPAVGIGQIHQQEAEMVVKAAFS